MESKKRQRSLYDTTESLEAKAERIVRKFSRRVQVRQESSVMFLYSRRPVVRKVCMECQGHPSNLVEGLASLFATCPLKLEGRPCPVDQAADEALIGLRALLYARVKAKIVFPAP